MTLVARGIGSKAMARYVVAKVGDIPNGEHIVVDAGGLSIGVFHIDGVFYGLLNRCPHRGAQMCSGTIVTGLASDRPGEYLREPGRWLIECPWHGWEFDIKTGRSYLDPKRSRVRSYPVDVKSGEEIVENLQTEASGDARLREGPYTADTIPILVEDEYVVVVTSR